MDLDASAFGAPAHESDARSAVMSGAIGVATQPPAGRTAPFRGRFAVKLGGPLSFASVSASGHVVQRRSADIARRSIGGYCIYRERSAGVRWLSNGQDFMTRAGDLIVTDLDTSYETVPVESFDHEAWAVPKSLLDPHLPAQARPLSIRLTGCRGIEALVATYLSAIDANWDQLAGSSMNMVADTLCRLIGLACGAAMANQVDTAGAGRLVAAKRYIDQHLADTDLTPAAVAAALRISVRGLHMLFEPTGTTFGHHVRRRRLEECRTALLANPGRPVLDVALAWGFGSMSSFYQAFRSAFGHAPNDLRALPQA